MNPKPGYVLLQFEHLTVISFNDILKVYLKTISSIKKVRLKCSIAVILINIVIFKFFVHLPAQ